MPSGFTEIGRRMPRREDRRFLTGQGRFLGDILFPRALHARFVRSPHAHARIVAIGAAAARAMPGVVAVIDGHDVARWATPLRMAPGIEGLHPTTMEPFPTGKVRFDGDLVACVVANTAVQAEDAAEAVLVDYAPLPAVASVADALHPAAAAVDDAVPGNLVSSQHGSAGDPARRFAEAHRVVEARFHQGRQTHAPLEPRSCCAVWDAGREHLTMHTGNQAPHPLRTQLAARLGLAESQVTVVCPDIGGAFGQKIALYREELSVAALARALNRTVRWQEGRGENLLAASHAREQSVHTRAAVAADGRVTALEVSITEDFGAYCFFPANYMARVVAMIVTGPYRIADIAFEVRAVLTNKCGAGPMRAPMAIASWVMDGTLEAAARALGLDPLAVRRRNMLTAAELPYAMPAGEVLRDVAPLATLDAALAAFDPAAFRARQAADRARGVFRGMGVCAVVEPTTYGSAFYKAAGIAGSGHEAAWVRVAPSGSVDASVGLMGSGQGYETALAQAVAEGLGIRSEAVRMQLGHTDTAPYGMGSRGARGGTAGGSVLLQAAQAVQRKACEIAATRLGLNSGAELRLRQGHVQRQVAGAWQNTGLTLPDIARIAYLDPLSLPPGMEPGLEAHRAYDPPAMSYSNAAHVCEAVVEVETGAIRLERYVVAEDCGTVLNPAIVEGQQHGAVAMGIGGVLREQVAYDADGHNLTGSFMDYTMSTASDLPPIEVLSVPTRGLHTPTGSKGMSEGGVMGAIGAVCSAVTDALAPFGVVVERQPLTPAAVRALLEAAPKAAPVGWDARGHPTHRRRQRFTETTPSKGVPTPMSPTRRSVLAAAGAALAAPHVSRAAQVRTMRFIPQANLSVLDPVWTVAAVAMTHGYCVFDTLYGVDSQFHPHPQMAAGAGVSDDGRTWTIRLRDGLRFHDGTPVRAIDCAASLERWSKRDTFGQTLGNAVDSFAAADDRTIRITLKRPFPRLLDAIGKPHSSPAFIMPERLARTDPNTQVTEMVGSGPFRFLPADYVSGASAGYARFEGYVPRTEAPDWTSGGKQVLFDRLEWHVVPDPATAAAALQRGEVDWWEQALPDLVPVISRDPHIHVQRQDPNGYLAMARFNMLQPPFDDVRLRRAVLMAVNQDDDMQAIMGDDAATWRRCLSMFPCGMPGVREPANGPMKGAAGLDAARAAVKAAGYSGQKVVLINPTDFPSIGPLGIITADLLRKLGFNVDLQEMDWGSVLQRRLSKEPVERGGWSLYHTNWPSVSIANPAVNTTVRGDGLWGGWFVDEETERVTAEWLFASDPTREQTLFDALNARAMDQVPILPLGQYYGRTAFRDTVTGVRPGNVCYFWGVQKA